VTGKCCDNTEHITNWGTDGLKAELVRATDAAEAAVAGAQLDENCQLFNPMDLWDMTDLDPFETVTDGGRPVWSDSDPVHLSADAYAEIAAGLMTADAPCMERPAKRARLESVIPMPSHNTAGRGRAGLVRPSPWVAGLVTSTGSRGRFSPRSGQRWPRAGGGIGSHQRSWQRGRGYARGSVRGRGRNFY